jgi:hypothetical protein
MCCSTLHRQRQRFMHLVDPVKIKPKSFASTCYKLKLLIEGLLDSRQRKHLHTFF